MDVIATLIAADRLGESDIRAARAMLGDAGLAVASEWWIDPGSACDLVVRADAALVRSALEGRLGQVDVVVQEDRGRRKRLLVADMDSTMIAVECIDELADYAGLRPQVAAVTEAAMRGELDFAEALRERVKLLVGLDESVIDQCRSERVRHTPGASTLVRTMKARGGHAILVSGGFKHFAEPVAQSLGFDWAVANALEVEGGKLAGRVSEPIVDAEIKRRIAVDMPGALGLDRFEVLAVGDGANDIPMLKAAGLGVAYRAKPAVRQAADAAIDHNDLTALLYVQGIARKDWVTG